MLKQVWIRRVVLFGIGLAIALLSLNSGSAIALSVFQGSVSETDQARRSDVVVERQGNIEYATVRLDGRPLFPVAAPVRSRRADATASDGGDSSSADDFPSAIDRVEQVEDNLSLVLANGLSPDDLRVETGSLNNQPVIFVSNRLRTRSLQIVTVTDLDVRLAGQSEFEVVADWVRLIRDGLRQALQERQPQYLWQQAQTAGKIMAGMVIASILVSLVQRFLKRRWNWLHQVSRDAQIEMHQQMQDEMSETSSIQELAVLKPLQYLAMQLPQLTLTRKRNINLILRRLLQWLQVAIWIGGIIFSLRLFPQTREFGQWLSQVPVRILAIVLVIGLIDKLGAVFIDYSLQVWAEQEAINPTGFHRQACRVPTFSVALKGLLMVVCLIGGIVWALYELRVPIAPVLTGAGIIGLAFSLSAQNLIRDMINGALILLEDQYAVGDVIAVDDVMGFVEYMNLRITQLRDPDGELVTIPNGSISTVRNLSNGWSRVNFEIEVSYETDVDQAMQVMEQVVEQMRSEPLWCDRIIEPAEILGVDRLAHTGVLIRVWIKTRPLQQWNVSREFRRRLKRAFEEHGVPIGVPQQSLWVRNAQDLLMFQQVTRSPVSPTTDANPDESLTTPINPLP
jgi:small conductance mechanosensitive channel